LLPYLLPLGTRSGGNILKWQHLVGNHAEWHSCSSNARQGKKGEEAPQKSDGEGLNFVIEKY